MTISIAATSPTYSGNSLTALEIVQETMAEVGLPVPTTLVANTDTLVQQILVLLNSAGRELMESFPWQVLIREWQFTTSVGDNTYSPPVDFAYLIANSQWNRTNVWPLLGPKNSQEWQYFKSGTTATGERTRYRLQGNIFLVYPTPVGITELGMEYVSACWVEDSTNSGYLIDRIVADDDRPLFNSTLLKKLLKIKIRAAKGLDTATVVDEFTILYSTLIQHEVPNTTVELDGVDVISVELASPVLSDNSISALRIAQEAMAELDMLVPTNLTMYGSAETQKLLLLINSAGRELVEAYPWQFLTRHWTITTVDSQDAYDLPTDWSYAIDQSQWDQTNHWPLLGPKTSQEWAYLKSGIVSSGPRIRYRVIGNKLYFHPVPGASAWTIVMDYISACWVARDCPSDNVVVNQVVYDVDRPLFNATLLKKLLKVKLAGGKVKVGQNGETSSLYDTATLEREFVDYYQKIVGKDMGAPILSMVNAPGAYLVGVNNIVDGNWPI